MSLKILNKSEEKYRYLFYDLTSQNHSKKIHKVNDKHNLKLMMTAKEPKYPRHLSIRLILGL